MFVVFVPVPPSARSSVVAMVHAGHQAMAAAQQAQSYAAPLGMRCQRDYWNCCSCTDGQATLLLYSDAHNRKSARSRWESVCGTAAAWLWEDEAMGPHFRLLTQRDCAFYLRREQYEMRQGPPPILAIDGAQAEPLQALQDQQPLPAPQPPPPAPGLEARVRDLEEEVRQLLQRVAALEAATAGAPPGLGSAASAPSAPSTGSSTSWST